MQGHHNSEDHHHSKDVDFAKIADLYTRDLEYQSLPLMAICASAMRA